MVIHFLFLPASSSVFKLLHLILTFIMAALQQTSWQPCIWWDWKLDSAVSGFFPHCSLCDRFITEEHLEGAKHQRMKGQHMKSTKRCCSWRQEDPEVQDMMGMYSAVPPSRMASAFCIPPPPPLPVERRPCSVDMIEDSTLMVLFLATKDWAMQRSTPSGFIDCLDFSLRQLAAHGISHVSQLEEAPANAIGSETAASLVFDYMRSCQVPFLDVAVDASWPRTMTKWPKMRRSYVTDGLTASADETLEDMLDDGWLDGLDWEQLGIALYLAYEDLKDAEGARAIKINYEDIADRCFQAANKGYARPDSRARLAILTSHHSQVTRRYIVALLWEKALEEDAKEEVEDEEVDEVEDEAVDEEVENEAVDEVEDEEVEYEEVENEAVEAEDDEEWRWNAQRCCWEVIGFTDAQGNFIGREDDLEPGEDGWFCAPCQNAGHVCGEAPPKWSRERWHCPCCGSRQPCFFEYFVKMCLNLAQRHRVYIFGREIPHSLV